MVELSATLPILRQKDAERMEWEYKHYYKGKGLCYFLVMERCKEFQVIRYYYKTSRSLFECMQIWLNEETKVVLAKNRFMGVDNWVRDSGLTIKDWFSPYYRYSYLGGVERLGWSGCIIRSLLPTLKKRGIKNSTHNIHPYKLCCSILANKRLETLFKLKQYLLVRHFGQEYYHLTDEVWQSIRVALRHGYHWDNPQEVKDWCDMINDLSYLELDTRNPHYICPANLEEAHQRFINLRHRKTLIDQWANEIKEADAYEPYFKATREQFFDMVLTDGEIVIKAIQSAKGIKEEGKAMHHCVGGYFNAPNSLILSATINGKRVETIEVNLKTYELIQSRGLQNASTKYHNRIVELVEKNLDIIRVLNVNHKSEEKKKLRQLKKTA